MPFRYENGDTKKRNCRHEADTCSSWLWTGGLTGRRKRAKILFELFPDLQKAFSLCHSLRMSFAKNTIEDAARLSVAKW